MEATNEIKLYVHNVLETYSTRLAKVESVIDILEHGIGSLKTDVKELVVLLHNHAMAEEKTMRTMTQHIADNTAETKSVKAWIVGMGAGLAAVATVITVLNQLGVL